MPQHRCARARPARRKRVRAAGVSADGKAEAATGRRNGGAESGPRKAVRAGRWERRSFLVSQQLARLDGNAAESARHEAARARKREVRVDVRSLDRLAALAWAWQEPVLALVAEVLGHALSHDRCVAQVARDQSLWAQLSQVLLPLHVSAGSAASDTTPCGTYRYHIAAHWKTKPPEWYERVKR